MCVCSSTVSCSLYPHQGYTRKTNPDKWVNFENLARITEEDDPFGKHRRPSHVRVSHKFNTRGAVLPRYIACTYCMHMHARFRGITLSSYRNCARYVNGVRSFFKSFLSWVFIAPRCQNTYACRNTDTGWEIQLFKSLNYFNHFVLDSKAPPVR